MRLLGGMPASRAHLPLLAMTLIAAILIGVLIDDAAINNVSLIVLAVVYLATNVLLQPRAKRRAREGG